MRNFKINTAGVNPKTKTLAPLYWVVLGYTVQHRPIGKWKHGLSWTQTRGAIPGLILTHTRFRSPSHCRSSFWSSFWSSFRSLWSPSAAIRLSELGMHHPADEQIPGPRVMAPPALLLTALAEEPGEASDLQLEAFRGADQRDP